MTKWLKYEEHHTEEKVEVVWADPLTGMLAI